MNNINNVFRKTLTALLIICLLSCSDDNVSAETGKNEDFVSKSIVEVYNNLQSSMVLQQNSKFIISGKGTPYQPIRINCSWEGTTQYYTFKVSANGSWSQQIAIPSGNFDKQTIIVEGKEKVIFSDILIGEVWLCSGQSNMWYPLKDIENGPNEVKDAANYPNIRFLNMAQVQSNQPVDNYTARWQVCSPSSAEWFSGVGYFFGKKLLQELKVPIGLINASWGDTTAEVWAERNAVLSNPLVKEDALKNDERPRADPNSPYKIGSAYNAMIYPVRSIPVAGVIWYQGEANMDYLDYYPHLLSVLANSWRQLWNVTADNMPFYISQICPYKREFDYITNYANPATRFAQQKASTSIPNSGVICNDDIADLNDIHPKNKQDVGLRFAFLALADKYKKAEFANKKSPVFNKYTIQDGKILVEFKYPDEGLKTRDGAEPAMFEIAGADRVFYPASAVLNGNKVELVSPMVASPVAARLGWSYTKTTNLISKFGLPVSVFKTYDWKDEAEEVFN